MKCLVISREGRPYLVRTTLVDLFGWSLKLHHILRSDEDKEPHDHPWSFWSLILWGGYFEETLDLKTWETSKKWHGPWTLRYCKAPHPHRLELPLVEKHGCMNFQPCITLVLTGPAFRNWGFYCKTGRWVPFLYFVDHPGSCEE